MSRVGICEEQAAPGQSLNIGRFVKLRCAKQGRITPAQVIGQDKDQVRLLGRQ